MPIIKYIEADGKTVEVEVPVGTTLMQAAVDNMISGILGDCGGGCSCGTCHCFIEEERTAELPEPDAAEESLLGMISDAKPNSRLGCQISVEDSLSGLVVHLPEEQTF